MNEILFDKILIKESKKVKRSWNKVIDEMVTYEKIKSKIAKKLKITVEEIEENEVFQSWERFNNLIKNY